MPLLQVLVLAIVQGLTEFLPVSSTAHLYLASWLFGWRTQPLEFDVALHTGTLLALLIYFTPDWIHILAYDHRMLALLATASIPVGIAGLAFNKQAEHSWRTPAVMGSMLIAIGIVLGLADFMSLGRRDLASFHLPDALIVGLSQVLALVPGASRSGVTIAAALFRDFSRESAARFSFLLSTPVIAAAAARMFYGMHRKGNLGRILNPTYLVAMAASTATGSLVIAWLLHYLRRGTFRPFVYYRVIFGIIVLALAIIRRPAG